MSNMNVTYAEMETAARSLKHGQADIEHKLHEMKTMIDRLVQEGYVTDRSSRAFDSSYTEFNDGVKKTIEGLDGMSQYLTQAANALRTTDEELAKGLGK